MDQMTDDTRQLIARIHGAGRQLVVATTGGGASAVAWLTSVPGASRSVLEARVPYHAAALADWLGKPPEAACSPTTSRQMAMAAWQRAAALVGGPRTGLVGIGATAALVSDRPKRGAHRAIASWQTESTTGTLHLQLAKGQRDRDAEEHLAAELVMRAIARALDIEPPELEIAAGDSLTADSCAAPAEWTQLLLGHRDWFAQLSRDANDLPTLIVPGSFHPLHAGHRGLARTAEQLTGRGAVFELSMVNVDKPSLDFIELRDRLGQFGEQSVVVTAAPNFIEKARLFPGATFAVGADTIARIAAAKYYSAMSQASRAPVETPRSAVNVSSILSIRAGTVSSVSRRWFTRCSSRRSMPGTSTLELLASRRKAVTSRSRLATELSALRRAVRSSSS